ASYGTVSAFCLCTVHTPKARRVNSGPSPIFTRRSYEPAPSPGQLRVGEDLPAALGVFTQLGAVFGARRQLVEGATPALAYNVAHGYGQHDMRLHGEMLLMAHRQPPSRATLERLAKDIGTAAVLHAPRIEPLVRRGEQVPKGTVAVATGLDRTAVAMKEQLPSGAPRKPEPKRKKPRVRRPPEPFDICWRMAYVGTVSFIDASGEALEVRRYALPACDDPRPLVEQMTADVRQALRSNPALQVGIVQDGAREMWDRTREGMQTLKDEGL